jgi:UrcA family protein
MKTTIATALLATAALGVGSALAQESTANVAGPAAASDALTRSLTVRFDADHIQSPRDAEKLFFQIRQAAEEVCRLASNPRGHELWEQHSCETLAVAKAVDEANVPELTRLYHGYQGRVEVGEPGK